MPARLQPGTFAPDAVAWGWDNRLAALRVAGSGASRRIEHRVAGADANPYLVLAAVLGGMLQGIAAQRQPPPPLEGESHGDEAEALPTNWDRAVERFTTSTFAETCFGARYKHLFRCCKEQELATFRLRVTDVEYDTYARTV